MQCDVNGYPWPWPSCSGRGSPASSGGSTSPGRRSPSTSRGDHVGVAVRRRRYLASRDKRYMQANVLGRREVAREDAALLPRTSGSSSRPPLPLRRRPPPMAGYYTDNAAPYARRVRARPPLERDLLDPRLQIATVSEFFRRLLDPGRTRQSSARPGRLVGGRGRGSAADRRRRQPGGAEKTRLSANLPRDRRARGDCPDWKATLEEAYLRARLYNEHTFGAAEGASTGRSA